ncbi:MAG TPA: hypothetical protein VGY54_21100 [Polyangiaceae bacterium]|jgi:hypothetical protein|nr:hypothetical protein [Polyangiaceae bacterium]
MKLTIESTDQIADIGGVAARVWIGTTEDGIKVFVFVATIAVPIEAADARAAMGKGLLEMAVLCSGDSSEEKPS